MTCFILTFIAPAENAYLVVTDRNCLGLKDLNYLLGNVEIKLIALFIIRAVRIGERVVLHLGYLGVGNAEVVSVAKRLNLGDNLHSARAAVADEVAYLLFSKIRAARKLGMNRVLPVYVRALKRTVLALTREFIIKLVAKTLPRGVYLGVSVILHTAADL